MNRRDKMCRFLVAGVFRKGMEEYRLAFEPVAYAVYCSEWDVRNYEVFRETMVG